MKAREQLKALQFQTRKGILFYGPPGTGKTYTIHYLASQLKNHTTLLVTAEQVGLLGEYFRLARFLQPSMMVIEDVDLIARAIEFPLAEAEGRAKLAKLYAHGLEISEELMELVVSRTKGVSGAFIKELLRRCAQFQIESSHGNVLTQSAVDAAIEEMLFAGGALNRRLLGGEGTEQIPSQAARLFS